MVNMDDALITLTSSDKQDIQISVKAATGSKFIVDALCLEDEEGIANELLLEVAKVDYSTLKTIVDFLNEYSAHPFASIDYESLRATGFEEVCAVLIGLFGWCSDLLSVSYCLLFLSHYAMQTNVSIWCFLHTRHGRFLVTPIIRSSWRI